MPDPVGDAKQPARRPTALITGGGGTLGRRLAAHLSQAGFALTLVGRRSSPLLDAARDLPHALCCPADVRDAAAIHEVIAHTLREHGRLDLAVHAAALLADPVEHGIDPWVHFTCVLRTNLQGAAVLAEACAPHMRPHGLIALIGSSSGHRPTPSAVAYGASKAALPQLTTSLAARYRDRRVRVVNLEAGHIGGDPDGYAADLANALLFLTSRHGRRVNGVSWGIDAGERLR